MKMFSMVIVSHCHTMRCYICGGFGHKAQDFWNSRRQSMRNASYNKERRVNETWKKDEVSRIEDHRTKVERPWHSRMRIENIEYVNMSGVNCCTKSFRHAESRV